MAITIMHGDLLKQDVDAIVNTVNCVGVMGKGIALQFKKKWPQNFKQYQKACQDNQVKTGSMFIYNSGGLVKPNFIINFPTKNHWRSKSQLQDIELGLIDLVEKITLLNIQSIAIPPLGCGNGGLEWSIVRPMIEQKLAALEYVDIRIFEPIGSPLPKSLEINTPRPKMTPGRAAIISLLEVYKKLDDGLTKVEIQKLAYFLQVSGENLRLAFSKNNYGPYSDTLRHVLDKMDGHFIQGFGDGNSPSEIIPLKDAVAEAKQFILEFGTFELKSRLDKVSRLIEGFQTPYGMELLATVHWVATEEHAKTLEDVVLKAHAWNDRKSKILKPEHIQVAWQHLKDENWI